MNRSWGGLPILLVFVIFTGCMGTRIVGLRPEYPPVRVETFSLYCALVEVDSLQPTFRWQPFEFPRNIPSNQSETDFENIENVTYEIRIWKTTAGRSGKLVYSRKGLTVPYHRIQAPLAHRTEYLWSIRAQFLLDGRPRVTEWSMAGHTLRNEAVPNESCFRFQTPVS